MNGNHNIGFIRDYYLRFYNYYYNITYIINMAIKAI